MSLIVAVAIYEILKLVRGTRAVQMGLGAGLLVLLFYVSRWGHLETVNWLIRNMVGYLVFALIVLFQADIRRALAHVGRTPFGRYFGRTQRTEETIEEIVVAAGLLVRPARRRHHRDRAEHRPAELHRGRHPPRRDRHHTTCS